MSMVQWHNIVDQSLFVWDRSHKDVLLLKYLPGIDFICYFLEMSLIVEVFARTFHAGFGAQI